MAIYVPVCLRKELLQLIHNEAHYSADKMIDRMKSQY
ncbi:MAG: hypothetical protein GY928_30015 [Colwellia sp.]|nr:hypothetical protein [Colwellia sp.]